MLCYIVICCNNLSWNNSNTIALIALFVSIGTLVLGIAAYRKFLVKKAQEKQLDVVLNVIESIHNCKNSFMEIWISPDGGRHAIRHLEPLSLFEIAESNAYDNDNQLYFFFTEGNPEILKWNFFTDYFTNPLLPQQIAQALIKFSFKDSHETIIGAINRSSTIIGNSEIDAAGTRIFYILGFSGATLETPSQLKQAAVELRQEIINWLNSYGITDINLTEK